FDVVYGMAVPQAAALQGALVKAELDIWTTRPRRGFFLANSQDPTVAKVVYNNGTTLVTSQPHWVSVYPLPIDKRVYGDFIWQTDPFQLDGGQANPKEQQPGVDMVLPYWVARSY